VKNVLNSWHFKIPSGFIFCGVTLWYWVNFDPSVTFMDKVIYWVIYAVIMLFLQYVIFVNAKRMIKIDELNK
jgi:hypothetical protein